MGPDADTGREPDIRAGSEVEHGPVAIRLRDVATIEAHE
jgi:hypothetical protein